MLAAALVGCGSKESEEVQVPDPETQPEAQAAVFQRACDRVKSLIEEQKFDQARQALEVFNSYKLTPEQQKVVDDFKAKIPPAPAN